jgi:alkanesulfonate monooxygenase SsuD/methylene tetrahydromethanopterin reductase-like flavin-dependent oxidoreductase (luciferase family)
MPVIPMKVGVLAGRFAVGEYTQLLDCAAAAEAGGLDAFYRSDHHLSLDGDFDRPVTEAWSTLSGLARETSRITLGILVSPVHFRHPTVMARIATSVDLMSDGRLEVGLGAGGYVRDRELMGLSATPLSARYSYLREYVQCLQGLWSDKAFSYRGDHFRYDEVRLEPRPAQCPHPQVIIGGKGTPAMIELVAELGVELNLDFPTLERCRQVRDSLSLAIARHRQAPERLPLSVEVHLPAEPTGTTTRAILDAYHALDVGKVVFFLPALDDVPAAITALARTVSQWRNGETM